MTPAAVQDVAQQAVIALLMVSGPAMAVALGIGLLVSLFQALTSIQEVTLTFVPKIIFVFVALLLFMPFMASRLQILTEEMFVRMAIPQPTDVTDAG